MHFVPTICICKFQMLIPSGFVWKSLLDIVRYHSTINFSAQRYNILGENLIQSLICVTVCLQFTIIVFFLKS